MRIQKGIFRNKLSIVQSAQQEIGAGVVAKVELLQQRCRDVSREFLATNVRYSCPSLNKQSDGFRKGCRHAKVGWNVSAE